MNKFSKNAIDTDEIAQIQMCPFDVYALATSTVWGCESHMYPMVQTHQHTFTVNIYALLSMSVAFPNTSLLFIYLFKFDLKFFQEKV